MKGRDHSGRSTRRRKDITMHIKKSDRIAMDVKIRREETTQEDLGVEGRTLQCILRNRT
jgi:hypothetical protein